MTSLLPKPLLLCSFLKCFAPSRFIQRSLTTNQINVCIVGSGPGGFYTAQQVLKNPNVKVDIYEKLPVPFGLVRFGVAPDHPEVKNVISTFTNTASNPNCSFFGNVCVGKDVTVEELKQAYNCIVFSYGAEEDRRLDIPGESLPNVLSARNFVGWYNGLPDDASLKVDLSVETAVIIGQGNVALDVARILLSPLETLKETDITEHAFEALKHSRIHRVVLVGRRGPLQIACTIKELREMVKLDKTRTVIHKEDFQGLEAEIQSLARPRKRLTELMVTTMNSSGEPQPKEWEMKFCRSPLHVIADDSGKKVKAVQLGINRLEGTLDNCSAVLTEETETIPCGLVLRSIGFKSTAIESGMSFNQRKGILNNTAGRVSDQKGMYCSGWVKTGPVGVIVSTMNSSFETGQNILKDIENSDFSLDTRPGSEVVLQILKSRNCKPVSFDDWKKIDAFEQETGKRLNKPREKLIAISKMLEVVSS